jgi:hypothetical protein
MTEESHEEQSDFLEDNLCELDAFQAGAKYFAVL